MISKIVIKGFQSHKKTIIKFDRITTIVGPSDIGKSAIIRAIQWVALNQPDGQSYINTETSSAHVVLRAEGNKITRLRSKSKNKYFLNGTALVSFGRNQVPDNVASCLNMSAINFQLQHDTPFWLGESAGNVSKQLNAVADLQSMDEASQYIAKEVKNAKAIFDQTTLEVETKKNLTKKYKQAKNLKRDFEQLQKKKQAAIDCEQKINKLKESIELLYDDKADIAYFCQYILLLKAKALALSQSEKCDKLSAVIKQAKLSRAIIDLNIPNTQAVIEQQTLTKFGIKLSALVASIKEKKKELWLLEKSLLSTQKLLPRTCPTCGQSISRTTHSHADQFA